MLFCYQKGLGSTSSSYYPLTLGKVVELSKPQFSPLQELMLKPTVPGYKEDLIG